MCLEFLPGRCHERSSCLEIGGAFLTVEEMLFELVAQLWG